MSLLTQAKLAADSDIHLRVTACVALNGMDNITGWAWAHQWQLSAQPGWDEKYAAAIAAGTASPGADEKVISDDMIRDAVTAIRDAD